MINDIASVIHTVSFIMK